MQENYLSYRGKGFDLFKILIVNFLLTVITLGLYYPWAKIAYLRYLYGQTEFKESRFQFHGLGQEVFKGFIIVFLIFGGVYGFYFWAIYTQTIDLAGIALLLIFLITMFIIPFAIHGALRYRMSRTTWRGIHFGYRGDRNELFRLYAKGLFLSIITFGIYGFWFVTSIRNYTISHIRLGDVKFQHHADGADFMILNIKGYFLTLITFGIYSFWWTNELLQFYVQNTRLYKNGQKARINTYTDGGGFFGLLVGNFFIVLFTLGLGSAWAITRTFNYILGNSSIEGDIDFDNIAQTEQEYKDAAGEDLLDFFDFDLI